MFGGGDKPEKKDKPSTSTKETTIKKILGAFTKSDEISKSERQSPKTPLRQSTETSKT